MPERPNPPKGASGRIPPPPLIQTVPARTRSATRRASIGSLHQTLAARPYFVSLASRIASSVSLNGTKTAIGPKISSWQARALWSSPPRSTGLTYQPFSGSGLVTSSSLRPPTASESVMKDCTRAW